MFNKILNSFKNSIVSNTSIYTNIDYSVDSNEEIKISLSMMKTKNLKFLETEKDDDYNRNKFLHKIGFKKLDRVKNFINTMEKVGNIEEYQQRCNYVYHKYDLELLNKEMLNIVKNEYSFNKAISTNFNGYLPNKAIDDLKKNFEKLEQDCKVFDFYCKECKIDGYYYLCENQNSIDNYIINNRIDILNLKVENYHNSKYWKNNYKELQIFYKDKKGMIVLEVEKDYYLVLCEWNEEEDGKLSKMNFKQFINKKTE